MVCTRPDPKRGIQRSDLSARLGRRSCAASLARPPLTPRPRQKLPWPAAASSSRPAGMAQAERGSLLGVSLSRCRASRAHLKPVGRGGKRERAVLGTGTHAETSEASSPRLLADLTTLAGRLAEAELVFMIFLIFRILPPPFAASQVLCAAAGPGLERAARCPFAGATAKRRILPAACPDVAPCRQPFHALFIMLRSHPVPGRSLQ